MGGGAGQRAAFFPESGDRGLIRAVFATILGINRYPGFGGLAPKNPFCSAAKH